MGGPEGGVDFEVDGGAFAEAVVDPGTEVFEGNDVGDDILAGDSAARTDAGEAGGEEEVHEFAAHAG